MRFFRIFQLCTALLSGEFFHILKHATEQSVKAQIHVPTICRMDTDTKITEQMPVFCHLVHITAQAGEATNQEYINLPILCGRMELQQAQAGW